MPDIAPGRPAPTTASSSPRRPAATSARSGSSTIATERCLYAVAYRIVGQRADAEEVVLEAFAQAWREAPAIRGGPWVGGGLAHDDGAEPRARPGARPEPARPHHGHGRRRPAGHVAAMGDSVPIPARALDHDERRRQVQDALGLLSPPQRQAIELAYFEGLSQSEIAERLKEPLGTVKTRVRLGMQKLRECLRPFYFERGT